MQRREQLPAFVVVGRERGRMPIHKFIIIINNNDCQAEVG
jgi:hypothetical protein